MGTDLHGPGQRCPFPFCPIGTWSWGTAFSTLPIPAPWAHPGQSCPIHCCPMGRACPVPTLPHGHSLFHPSVDHHLPRHSSALSPSDPWAQPARCPLPRGTGTSMGPAPAGAWSPPGCPCPSPQGACPPRGARAASAAGPVCRGAGWAVGQLPAARPRSCAPGSSQLPTWEERGEIWSAVAGDIGEGGPWGGGGGGGGRRRPTVSCLYERTVQTTCPVAAW